MAGWYIRRGEKIVGPVDAEKLQELTAAGQLLPTDHLSKSISGPWGEAGKTKLFAPPTLAEKQTSSISVVPTTPQPLVTVDDSPTSPNRAAQISLASLRAIGRGFLATFSALSRSMSARSQRRHEIKVARIQATAIRESQPALPSRPAAMAPQIHQTTVVKVVNTNTQYGYGCSGCFVVILLAIIAAVVFFIVAAVQQTP